MIATSLVWHVSFLISFTVILIHYHWPRVLFFVLHTFLICCFEFVLLDLRLGTPESHWNRRQRFTSSCCVNIARRDGDHVERNGAHHSEGYEYIGSLPIPPRRATHNTSLPVPSSTYHSILPTMALSATVAIADAPGLSPKEGIQRGWCIQGHW